MLKTFSVKNFKNFKEEITLDFSKTREYGFNDGFIKNNIVNKALVYGPNNSGKSNLGVAIVDIVRHLTDFNGINNRLYSHCINGDYKENEIIFNYLFDFDGKEVTYVYKKDKDSNLLYEELLENGELLFKYNYRTGRYTNNIPKTSNIDLSNRNNNVSALKYLSINNLSWAKNDTLKQLVDFANGMLWFRSLNRGNEFIGVLPASEEMNTFIIKSGLLKEFETFLSSCGQSYKLCTIPEGTMEYIGVKFKTYQAKFSEIASTGTHSLWLIFYWMYKQKNISFIFLDEFDAFYDFRLSAYILNYINQKADFQSVLTTHNTNLIDNELMRPDCYLYLNNGKISSFADNTNKTIRQAHNLEKMMLGGEFEA